MADIKNMPMTDTTDREIITTRVYDYPRELVFKAWTDPKHLDKWWGPNGFRNETHEFNFKVGGIWRFTMHGPDGIDYPNLTTYLEIVPPKRLVYDHGAGHEGEKPLFRATVTFEETNGKTTVTMRAVFSTKEVRDRVVEKHNAIEGGKQTMARLAEYLQKI
jgi:uncharacterized protein YndB with AHSA1/START domain